MFGFGKNKGQIISMGDDDKNTLGSGLKWLAEMEAVNDPTFNNALVLNIYKTHPFIKDVEVITDSNNKKMLIWVKLEGWLLRPSKAENIKKAVTELLVEVLPSYKIKVITDKTIFDRALTIVKDEKTKLV